MLWLCSLLVFSQLYLRGEMYNTMIFCRVLVLLHLCLRSFPMSSQHWWGMQRWRTWDGSCTDGRRWPEGANPFWQGGEPWAGSGAACCCRWAGEQKGLRRHQRVNPMNYQMELHQWLILCNYLCRAALEIIARWIKALAIEKQHCKSPNSSFQCYSLTFLWNYTNRCLDSCQLTEVGNQGVACRYTCSKVNCTEWCEMIQTGNSPCASPFRRTSAADNILPLLLASKCL